MKVLDGKNVPSIEPCRERRQWLLLLFLWFLHTYHGICHCFSPAPGPLHTCACTHTYTHTYTKWMNKWEKYYLEDYWAKESNMSLWFKYKPTRTLKIVSNWWVEVFQHRRNLAQIHTTTDLKCMAAVVVALVAETHCPTVLHRGQRLHPRTPNFLGKSCLEPTFYSQYKIAAWVWWK